MSADGSSNVALGESTASLAWGVLGELLGGGKDGGKTSDAASPGTFLSPVSLFFALGLALRGARGVTAQELLHLLRQDKGRLLGLLPPKDADAAEVDAFLAAAARLGAALSSSSSKDGAGAGAEELILANAIWTNKVALLPAYVAAARELFAAEAATAATTDPINAWAAKATKGLITTAVPPGTKFDVVLTNAVYFKGLWEFKFDKALTRTLDFALLPGGGPEGSAYAPVPMMHRTFKPADRGASAAGAAAGSGGAGGGGAGSAAAPPLRVTYSQQRGYTAVRLPYVGGRVAALAVLPSDAEAGVGGALAGIDARALLDPGSYKPPPPAGLEVFLPRFKVASEGVSLKPHLAKLGLSAPFDASAADFSGLSAETRLHVSDVLQSVCVIVDEEGTEAAAVTSVVMLRSLAVLAEPVIVRFDRPFLFLLVDEASRAVLFAGAVTDPSKSPA